MDTSATIQAQEKPTLAQRVRQFEMLELPGQPQMMHMGTSYLVHDLWQEIERLRVALVNAKACIKAQMQTEVTANALAIIDGVLTSPGYVP